MSSSPAHLSRLEPVIPDRSALTCWSGAPKQLGDATVPAHMHPNLLPTSTEVFGVDWIIGIFKR